MSSSMKLSNNGIGRLSANAAAAATTLSLVPGDGAKFPALAAGEYFPLTVIRASDGAIEIVKVTARATDVLTIQRAQETTAALSFLAGDRVELRMTAGSFTGEITRIETKADTALADSAQALTDSAAGLAAASSAQTAASAAQTAASAAQTASAGALQRSGGVMTGDLQMGAGTKIVMEGTTDDAFETTIDPGNPTADRTLSLPDESGTIATIANVDSKIATAMANLPITSGRTLLSTPGSGTFTVQSTSLKVTVIGGGGSGGGPNDPGQQAGGGGGPGGAGVKYINGLTIGSTISYTVGAGGAATAASANGNTGGTSSFGAHITATGGGGGARYWTAGTNGTVSGADVTIPVTSATAGTTSKGGNGGNIPAVDNFFLTSVGGIGPAMPGSSGVAGGAASGVGAGGGGGASASWSATGGKGADGCIIIEWGA